MERVSGTSLYIQAVKSHTALKHHMELTTTIQQIQNIDPKLASQLNNQICSVCREALLDFEGLLTTHLDSNVFNIPSDVAGSISTMARIISQLTGKTVEDILLEIRHGDSWQEETPEQIPDWADPEEFPKASNS